MNPFTYTRAGSAEDAVALVSTGGAKFLGGGTNLVDLMRESVEHPTALVDVTTLDDTVEQLPNGGVRIGGAARNTAVAENGTIRSGYPLVSRAIAAGASGQLRNMATVAGNGLQRTRCTYFYDVEGSRCNKRRPGEGCDALEGANRGHAVLGTSTSCIATHPSDMCVALVALDATVHLLGPDGPRSLPLRQFHRPPDDRPDLENALGFAELITAIELPPPLPFRARSTYRKVRDRASYAFALVSVAAALDVGPGGEVRDVRLALGGVGTTPWRATRLEETLVGRPATERHFIRAADAELSTARSHGGNDFKIDLARRTIVSVLGGLTEARP